MKIQDIMTPHARCVCPQESVAIAASLMRELNVGALPVCDNDRLAGVITDRDITVRAVADGADPKSTPVQAIMSHELVYIFEDQEIDEAARLMEVKQIRRLPVLNRNKRLVGIVSLGDMAVEAGTQISGEALKEISQPVHATATR